MSAMLPEAFTGIYKKILSDEKGPDTQTRIGQIHSHTYFLKVYKNALAAIGVQYISPHGCRHTYSTRLDAAHIDETTRMASM